MHDLGARGEQIAVNYLLAGGYEIMLRNWRLGVREIDIVAWRDVWVFVEVKTRVSERFGFPEEALTARKRRALAAAIEDFIFAADLREDYRVDVVSILLHPGGLCLRELRHFQDVVLA
jgi:putative endonuclease